MGGLWFPCPKESEAALTDSSRGAGVLGLFPSFGTIGGVQASGQLAWRGITRSVNPVFGRRSLISYGRDGHGPARPGTGQALAVSSKLGAAAVALRRRWPAHVVLVWHLDLLKYLFLLRLSNARTVLFLHGIEAWKPRSLPVRALLRRVHRFLSNSDHTWERFVARCPELREAPHCTVHLGIGEAVRGEIPRPASTPIALMISRLLRTEDYKGHREVIDAWPLVTERVPGAELWIVGDGDLRADLEAVVQGRGLAGKVRLLGVLPEVGKEEALIRSRCLLMPSRAEGFGLVYLEAMRVARPCLVSTVDGGREVVNPPEAGLAVAPADTRQLADAVSRLLSHGEEWESWSRRARRRYEDHFTAARFEQRLVSAVSEVAGGDGSAT